MRVYISNYASYKGDQCVQISKTATDWTMISKQLHELYPAWPLIKSVKDTNNLDPHDPRRVAAEEHYTEVYRADVERVISDVVPKLENGDVLCCWRKRGSFCHRYIVQKVLEARGIECREV